MARLAVGDGGDGAARDGVQPTPDCRLARLRGSVKGEKVLEYGCQNIKAGAKKE